MSLDERLIFFGEIAVKSSVAEGILDKKFRACLRETTSKPMALCIKRIL